MVFINLPQWDRTYPLLSASLAGSASVILWLLKPTSRKWVVPYSPPVKPWSVLIPLATQCTLPLGSPFAVSTKCRVLVLHPLTLLRGLILPFKDPDTP